METSDQREEIFTKCKNLIDNSNFECLAESLISFKKFSDESERILYLKRMLSKKLQEICKETLVKANSLKSIVDVNQLELIVQSYKSLQCAKTLLNDFIDLKIAKLLRAPKTNESNDDESSDIELQVNKTLKTKFDKYLKDKSSDLNVFDDNRLREILSVFLGSSIFDLIDTEKKEEKTETKMHSVSANSDINSELSNKSETEVDDFSLSTGVSDKQNEGKLSVLDESNVEDKGNEGSKIKEERANNLNKPLNDSSPTRSLDKQEVKKNNNALNECAVQDEAGQVRDEGAIGKKQFLNDPSSTKESEEEERKIKEIEEKLECSIKEFSLNSKIDFDKFNALEGFSTSLDNMIESLSKTYGTNSFAQLLFRLMIYLIKRQQDLSDFILKLNDQMEKEHEIEMSLRELVFNLVLNCEQDVKHKIFQLLHVTNPVPFSNYFLTRDKECELEFHSETYWLMDGDIDFKIISLSLDVDCKGKTSLLNGIFCTGFEENVDESDSIFFNGTMDLQIVKKFGAKNLCIVDTHGNPPANILDRLAKAFDIFIIHINEKSLSENIEYLIDYLSRLPENARIFLFIRDSKKVKNRANCIDQEFSKKTYSSSSIDKVFKRVTKVCQMPKLSEKKVIESYARILRDFFCQEFAVTSITNKIDHKKSFLNIFSQDKQEEINKIELKFIPLVDKLKNAIRNAGINEPGFFALYPLYFECNLLQNELNKLEFFAENAVRVNSIRTKYFLLNNELENKARNYDLFSNENRAIVPETFVQSCLRSDDIILILNCMARQINQLFHKELSEKLNERDALLAQIRTLTSNNQNHVQDGECLIKQAEFEKLVKLIDYKRISLEVIWREVILIYKYKNSTRKDYSFIRDTFSRLIFKGQPFEILDGDNFQFNKQILLDIFQNEFKIKNSRIRVVSILGPQNSGKSTLLNFMFGCDFTVSDGRCTRGIYGSLIKSNNPELFDYFLVLDTEGLQSIEKGDKEYDRKLILFCFAVSNVLIINTKDQITDDVKTTLETCVDSLSKIDCVRVQKPSVFFVMNQMADPNRKTDQEAINKILSSFSKNDLITQLQIDVGNFETLPTAFNTNIIELNHGKEELRRLSTNIDFIKRSALFTNNIVKETNQIKHDQAFSDIYNWIDFSEKVFKTINAYPDLIFFKDIVEKSQNKSLQEYLSKELRSKLSKQVRDNLFTSIESINILTKAEEKLSIGLNDIKTVLLNDLEDYFKRIAVNESIRNMKREFLISQINRIEESWLETFRIKVREKKMRKVMNAAEGILKDRIHHLLRSGAVYDKDQAGLEFNKLFDERSSDISKNINETLGKGEIYFNSIYSLYAAIVKEYLPSRETMFKNAVNQSEIGIEDPLIPTNSLYNGILDLKKASNNFKIVDRECFDGFYNSCKLNLLDAVDYFQKYKNLEINKRIRELETSFKINLNNKSPSSEEISLTDMKMIDFPSSFNEIQNEFKTSRSFPQKLKERCQNVKAKASHMLVYLRGKSNAKTLYLEEEFSSVIKDFIYNYGVSNKAVWSIAFDELKYKEKIHEILEEININKEEEIDYELIQNLIFKAENVFEQYNNDLSVFDLSLSRNSKSFAHNEIFKRLLNTYANKRLENAENELDVWNNKKENLCKFFVSQLAPDHEKDKENAKHFLELFSEELKNILSMNCIYFVEEKLKDNEENFSRLKILEQRDQTLNSLSPQQLLSYVLKPTEFLADYFKTIWKDLENSINNELKKKHSEFLKYFDTLKEILAKLHELISKKRATVESFNVNEIFQIKHSDSLSSYALKRENSIEINKIVHMKGLCASDLVFSLICQNGLKQNFTPFSFTILSRQNSSIKKKCLADKKSNVYLIMCHSIDLA
jgi:hypothetical protein